MSKQNLFEAWAEKIAEQWRVLGALVAAVLVVIAGMGIVNSMRAKQELAATNALYEAQTAAHKAVAEKNFDAAEQAYTGLLANHKGTRAAFEGELQLGDMWMDAANYDKAIAHYQQAAGQSKDSFSKLLATYTIGIAQESAGKLSEAVKSYDDALATAGSDFLRPEILMAQARCYEALKQPQKAIELYKTVQEKFATRAYYSGAASAFEKQLAAGAKSL